MRDVVCELVMVGIIFGFTLTRDTELLMCDGGKKLRNWLIVMGIISVIQTIKQIGYFILLGRRSRLSLSVRTVELCFGLLLLLFKISWFIYGNVVVYSDRILACKDESDDTRSLWILSIVLLVIGYLHLLIVIIMLIYLIY